jgi:hypothetical protein
MIPQSFELLTAKHGQRIVYESDESFVGDEKEQSYSMKFAYNGKSSSVTWFPERGGVRLSAFDDPSTIQGERRVIFAVICMKLILSGRTWVKDV